jgi:hypothetical protein
MRRPRLVFESEYTQMGVMTMHDVGVRYGSLADKVTSPRHDRFTPNNGRWTDIQASILAVQL